MLARFFRESEGLRERVFGGEGEDEVGYGIVVRLSCIVGARTSASPWHML